MDRYLGLRKTDIVRKGWKVERVEKIPLLVLERKQKIRVFYIETKQNKTKQNRTEQ